MLPIADESAASSRPRADVNFRASIFGLQLDIVYAGHLTVVKIAY